MVRYSLAIIAACTTLGFLSGCGEDKPIPVSGTVKNADGSIPKFDMMSINFQPEDATKLQTASGDVDAKDGSFKLQLSGGEEGALPGKYKVEVSIVEKYPPEGPPKRPAVEPASVEVKKGEDNKFKFTIQQ